jgi:hypothetical protein
VWHDRHNTTKHTNVLNQDMCCMHSQIPNVLWCAADAHKTGVAQEAAKTATKVAKGISPAEARQILHVDPQASWVDVTKVGVCATQMPSSAYGHLPSSGSHCAMGC